MNFLFNHDSNILSSCGLLIRQRDLVKSTGNHISHSKQIDCTNVYKTVNCGNGHHFTLVEPTNKQTA